MLTNKEKKSDYLETLAEELRLNGFPAEVEDNEIIIQAIFGEYRQAIKILSTANRWRRGADVEMPDPKEFGEAIDVAISIMEAMLVKETRHE